MPASAAPSLPDKLPALWSRLEARFEGLPPQLRRAAAHMRAQPQQVALNSLRSFAAAAEVSPASITRLLAALDLGSWESLQELHRGWLLGERAGPFSPKAEAVIRGGAHPEAGESLLDRLLEAETQNLAAGLTRENRQAIRAAAGLLHASPRIGIAGLRSCFAIAHSLAYSLTLFRAGIRQFTGLGGLILDELGQLQPGDALVVISFDPYTRDAVALARKAREAGIRLVAITDRPLAPVAIGADALILVRNDSPAPIASPIGPMIATQALALEILARSGAPAQDAIHRREALLAEAAIYHPTP